jgi:biotin carboxyl carrier protein
MKQLTFNIMDNTFQIGISKEDKNHFAVCVGEKAFQGSIEDKSGNNLLVAVEGVLFNIELADEEKQDEFSATVNCRERIVMTRNLPGKRSIGGVQKPEIKHHVETVKEEYKTHSPKVSGGILAPMPGRVVKVNVDAGDVINAGDVVLILEAMKMENEICANRSGTVKEVHVAAGDSVDSNDVLVVIE